MHFAAYSLVGESVEKPLDYYRNNLAKTIELLDAMNRHNVKYFIFSSTAAVYGEPMQVRSPKNTPVILPIPTVPARLPWNVCCKIVILRMA